ncbi:MAG: hypothetical protein O7F76_05475, partial [Planctomycetota bacterium]|nr:hypothetical protein [Planctomycetota bacterium]
MRASYMWAALAAALISAPVLGQLDEDGTHVTLRGQSFEVFSPDRLRARGLEVPEIPRERNAAWVYVDAINKFVLPPQDVDHEVFDAAVAGTWPEGEAGNKLSDWLEQNEQALDLTRRAASMPEYHMPLFRGDSDALLMALLPHLAPQRQLAKLLSVDATRQMAQGRAEAAIENYLTTQRMGHQVGHGNTLIEGLVGIAVSGLAERGFMRVADSGAVDGAVLQAAGAELDRLADSFPDWDDMVRAEQKWATSAIDDMLELPGTMNVLFVGASGPTPPRADQTGWSRLATRLKRLYLPDRSMKKHMRDHYEALIAASKHEDGSVGIDLEAEAALMTRLPAWDVLGRILLPSFSRSHELALRGRSNLVRARTALAVAA